MCGDQDVATLISGPFRVFHCTSMILGLDLMNQPVQPLRDLLR